MADYTQSAEELFDRFGRRHRLSHTVKYAPGELCWVFPEQTGLALPITLGLQNGDELNFSVADFWSYFFPFREVAKEFEEIIDAWIVGAARIAVFQGRGRTLEASGDLPTAPTGPFRVRGGRKRSSRTGPFHQAPRAC